MKFVKSCPAPSFKSHENKMSESTEMLDVCDDVVLGLDRSGDANGNDERNESDDEEDAHVSVKVLLIWT